MPDGNVYSHPGKLLENHLLKTQQAAKEIARKFRISIGQYEELSILLHDIAKAHPAFQKRLETGFGKFGHAEPSAALVLGQTRDLICTEAVRRHHSHLQNVEEFTKFWGEWNYQERGQQLIRKLKWWPEAEKVVAAINLDIKSWVKLLPSENEWNDILADIIDVYGLESGEVLMGDWLRLRLLYSLLVTADRFEAAVGGNLNYAYLSLDMKRVDSYTNTLQKRPLSEWRQEVRRRVVAHSRLVLEKPGVYTLTLPTGTGKTLVGLQVAMEAAQRFNSSGIIYVLPFVSLVEQNAGVARQFFDEVREDHHLSYNAGDGEETTPRERFLEFFRYWQEPVIVTTMAKFWEVLYSPRANNTMSFHRLSHAVIILDEPQAIPTRCWEGFGKTLEVLARKLGTTFILMTATQPEIATGVELVPEPICFPGIRHEFRWIKQQMTIETAAEFLEEQGVLIRDSLLVLNTRKSALLMWKEMKQRGLDPYFMSRWVTPIDRSIIMQQIKDKEIQKEQRCLVSTQVIEAGIDIDFDLVFRDLGPLDSIIQVAGRCNRNFQHELGTVLIAELKDEKRSYATYVYDSVLLNQTRNLLNKNANFNEAACPEIISSYYRNVRGAINNSELWDNIIGGRWGEYIPLFEQWDNDEGMLVVDYDGTSCQDLVTLQELGNREMDKEADKMELLRRRREIFRKLSHRAIPVPVKYLEEWYHHTGSMIIGFEENIISNDYPGIWVVRDAGIGRIYRRDIGFVPMEIAQLLEEEPDE